MLRLTAVGGPDGDAVLTISFCACCETPAPAAPADLFNRPGLSEIGFRIGTFATFREAMLESIARQPELAGLTTRESDDYAITLLELFAAVGDVLTFYNERIANELFLRTARERDSLLRLVRLIGYHLRPGLAATAMLAFTLDTGADTRIRKGLKVMSMPGQDEKPQIFETIERDRRRRATERPAGVGAADPVQRLPTGTHPRTAGLSARAAGRRRPVRSVRSRHRRGEGGRRR